MDKIEILLKKLDNKVTPTIAKRINGLNDLFDRLDLAKKDLEANPDDEELKESLEEITDYINDYEDDLIDDLEDLLEAREKAKNDKPKEGESKKANESKKEDNEPKEDSEKKKSSGGLTALVIGSVLLVASIGAINIFKNNR